MEFAAIGLTSPSPRHGSQSKGSSSCLPPLVPATTEFVTSPRRIITEIVTPSPSAFSIKNNCHNEKPHGYKLRATQVASWPLTFTPGSPTKRGQTDDLDPFSPISPKVHKLQTRTRLVDDSRTRPALLQELLSFLQAELDNDEREDSMVNPSLRRLQVVREALNRLIAGFSVYAPVLVRIRDEYEHVVEALYARSLTVSGLHTRLQSVETHCLRQLSACSAEAKARSRTLQRRLSETQALLAASAAANARLNAALQVQKETVAVAESKLAELQRSTLALANSVRRHDESLRAGHERSLEDARALQKVTARYYHACDELAELKKTVAALEERGNGEHVAADKDTIELLSREVQELSAALMTASEVSRPTNSAQETRDRTHVALNHAFMTGLDGFGLELELPDLLNGITSASSLSEGIDATATMITQRLRQVQQQQFALLTAKRDTPGDQQSSVVFLTEPAELMAFAGASAEQVVPACLSISIATGDLIPGRGMSSVVPSYLQYDGVVRNLFLPRAKIEQLVGQVWDQLEDQLRVTHNRHATRTAVNDGAIAVRNSSPGASLLTLALERVLQRARDSRADRVELVYNFLTGLERFSAQSSACRLFHLVWNHQLPVEARSDQKRELARLHDALVVVDHDRHFHSSSETELTDTSSSLPPGRVSLSDVVRTLRLIFPWKSDAALSQLHRALLVDLRGYHQVDYTTLLTHHSPVMTQYPSSKPRAGAGQTQVKWQFNECLKMQHLDDLLSFRRHVQDKIQRYGHDSSELLPDSEGAFMISLHDVRVCLQAADSAMPEPEATRILTALSGLNARELLTHDDMVLDTRQVLERLPTLLLRPTGRFLASNT